MASTNVCCFFLLTQRGISSRRNPKDWLDLILSEVLHEIPIPSFLFHLIYFIRTGKSVQEVKYYIFAALLAIILIACIFFHQYITFSFHCITKAWRNYLPQYRKHIKA